MTARNKIRPFHLRGQVWRIVKPTDTGFIISNHRGHRSKVSRQELFEMKYESEFGKL